MNGRKPLVLADDRAGVAGQPIIQQLQSGDDLDVPLRSRVERLERSVGMLAAALLQLGLDLPPELITTMENI